MKRLNRIPMSERWTVKIAAVEKSSTWNPPRLRRHLVAGFRNAALPRAPHCRRLMSSHIASISERWTVWIAAVEISGYFTFPAPAHIPTGLLSILCYAAVGSHIYRTSVSRPSPGERTVSTQPNSSRWTRSTSYPYHPPGLVNRCIFRPLHAWRSSPCCAAPFYPLQILQAPRPSNVRRRRRASPRLQPSRSSSCLDDSTSIFLNLPVLDLRWISQRQ